MKTLSQSDKDAIIAMLQREAQDFRNEGGYYFDLQRGEPFEHMFRLYKHVHDFFMESNGYDIVNDLLSAFHGSAFISNPYSLVKHSDKMDGENRPETVTLNRVDFSNLLFRIQEISVFLLKLEAFEARVFDTQRTLKHFD